MANVKGTAEYEEWLRKYREKRKKKSQDIPEQYSLNFGPEFENVKRVLRDGKQKVQPVVKQPQEILPKGTKKSVYSKSEDRNLNCEIIRYVPSNGKYLVYREDGKYLYYSDKDMSEPRVEEVITRYTNGKKNSVSVVPKGSASEKIEKTVAPIAFDICKEGLQIDKDTLAKIKEDTVKEYEECLSKLQEIAGHPVNVSTKDAANLLFEELKFERISGNSTAADVLEKLQELHPESEVPSLIMRARSANKLLSGYISKLERLSNVGDGRVRNMFNPSTVSGRYATEFNPVAIEVPDSVKTEDKIYFQEDLEEIGLPNVCPIK